MGAIVEGAQDKEVTPPTPDDPSIIRFLDQVIQKCIAGILIDREALVARIGVRRIPAVTPEIEKALRCDGNEDFVVSCQSARNRVHT